MEKLHVPFREYCYRDGFNDRPPWGTCQMVIIDGKWPGRCETEMHVHAGGFCLRYCLMRKRGQAARTRSRDTDLLRGSFRRLNRRSFPWVSVPGAAQASGHVLALPEDAVRGSYHRGPRPRRLPRHQ